MWNTTWPTGSVVRRFRRLPGTTSRPTDVLDGAQSRPGPQRPGGHTSGPAPRAAGRCVSGTPPALLRQGGKRDVPHDQRAETRTGDENWRRDTPRRGGVRSRAPRPSPVSGWTAPPVVDGSAPRLRPSVVVGRLGSPAPGGTDQLRPGRRRRGPLLTRAAGGSDGSCPTVSRHISQLTVRCPRHRRRVLPTPSAAPPPTWRDAAEVTTTTPFPRAAVGGRAQAVRNIRSFDCFRWAGSGPLLDGRPAAVAGYSSTRGGLNVNCASVVLILGAWLHGRPLLALTRPRIAGAAARSDPLVAPNDAAAVWAEPPRHRAVGRSWRTSSGPWIRSVKPAKYACSARGDARHPGRLLGQ